MIAIGGAAVVAVAVGGWLLVRGLDGDASGSGAVGDAGAGARVATGGGDAGVRTTATPDGPPKRVEPIRQAPDSPDRPMPYRPAKFLRYSDGMPAKNAGDDDASPILERILQVTKPTGEQEASIRAAWRAHEDSRRVLVAKARPPSIGEPILDRDELAEVDRAFEELLAATLRHEQLARLALEMPPPEPEPEPPPP